jgi:predicted phosphodiesterase
VSDAPLPVLHRVGVIGDVHGEDAALEAAVNHLSETGPCDAVLCTGDVPDRSGTGDAERCCTLLREHNVRTIRGNHDRWLISDPEAYGQLFSRNDLSGTARGFLAGLPPTRTFDTPLGQALLCHGVGTDDMAGIYPGGEDDPIRRALKERRIYGWYRLLVCGHTHRRLFRPLGSLAVVNAGTLRWEENPCFLSIDFDDGTVQFYDLKPMTNEITKAETYSLFAE